MDTQNLQTFITVVKLGSFTKASEQSFISPTAIMKQINKLENELDCSLFERTKLGVSLTNEGENFLPYAEKMLELSQQAYLACRVNEDHEITLRLGSSLLHPSKPFFEVWNRLKNEMPEYKLIITQIPSDLTTSNREYEALGDSCDLLIATFDEATTKNLVDAVSLGAYRFSIALPLEHPFSEKEILEVEDLDSLTLHMVPRGISKKNDALRDIIEKKAPNCRIVETDGRYDLDTFNRAYEENAALINLTPWEDIHPALVSIPLDTDITVDFGLLANKKAPTYVKAFLKNIQYNILTKMGEYGPLEYY